jgi:hypothetical protein
MTRCAPNTLTGKDMTLTANAHDREWSVDVSTSAEPVGGYRAMVHVAHNFGSGAFEYEFRHNGTFLTEREALLEGLREGMTWIELKIAGAMHL